MNSFDEKILTSELSTLDPYGQTAFGLASATRQLCNFEYYANKFKIDGRDRPCEIISQLWDILQQPGLDKYKIYPVTVTEVMELIPEEDNDWTIWYAIADDSLSYTINYLTSFNSQEAAWAARRAYEAADQVAIRILDIQPGSSSAEELIKAHPVVQRELSRRRRGIVLLRSIQEKNLINEIQKYAFDEKFIIENELDVLIKKG